MNEAKPSYPSYPARCGFVSLIGLTNAGKSTLVNALVGSKVSIVSHKVQTTRTRILGILTTGPAQILFIDGPGIFPAKKTLEKAMLQTAWDILDEGSVTLHLVDASRKEALAENKDICERLDPQKNCLLLLNKIDKINKPDLLALAKDFNEAFAYKATFMISARQNAGLEDFLKALIPYVPESPWLFPEDQISDAPMRFLAAEITREKIYEQLHKELPYAAFVETESWENFDNGDVKIHQTLYVEKDSQKAIILGKNGSRIKALGQDARAELEKILDTKVHLKLFVKVKKNWSEQTEFLSRLFQKP